MKKQHLALVLGLAALAACTGESSKSSSGKMVAKVGDELITDVDVDAEVASLPPQWQTRAKTPQGRNEIIENIVKRRLLLAEAKARGIPDRPEVHAQIEKATSSQVLRVLMKEQQEQEGPVADKELRDYFEEHKEQFEQQEQVRASHILVKLAPNASAPEEAAAKKKADDFYKKVKSGADFETVAKTASDGPSGPRGGDLGYFDRRRMDPKFTEVAFNMKVGEISQPVRTSFGYHVIKVTDRRDAQAANFDEMKEEIQRRVEPQLKAKRFENFVAGLRDKYKVEIVEPEAPATPAPDANPEAPEGAQGGAPHPMPMPMPMPQQPASQPQGQ